MTKLIQGKPSCKIKIIFFCFVPLSLWVCLFICFLLAVCVFKTDTFVSFNFYGISLCFIVLFFSTLQLFFFFLSFLFLSLVEVRDYKYRRVFETEAPFGQWAKESVFAIRRRWPSGLQLPMWITFWFRVDILNDRATIRNTNDI
jgi:hypothetical protein